MRLLVYFLLCGGTLFSNNSNVYKTQDIKEQKIRAAHMLLLCESLHKNLKKHAREAENLARQMPAITVNDQLAAATFIALIKYCNSAHGTSPKKFDPLYLLPL